ncbi:pickpocket protein 28 [Drosophila pseudoobscura]|uniref:Pickpocket protein 28 n=1 Tax=Drosophila pseudoobscura pseudoobscura TaxID=46245 RepID=A0A6I8UHP3_DROPS|nr:pickpocket protein 28 [Drosophila pseudoobscura]
MKALTDSKRRLSLSSNFNDDDQDEDDDTMCSGAAVKRSIVYYLKNSTLHGLKYIAEESITIPERVFFGISFVLVVILSGFFISNVYVKWSASPIIISTSAKQKLTSNMPFPAITICNLNQALLSRVQRISRSSSNFSLLMGLCDQGGDLTISYIGTWKYFKAILVEVAQPCDEMLLYCSFGSRQEQCTMLFNSILTDDGLCCNFNALDPSYLIRNYSDDVRLEPPQQNGRYEAIDWTAERGYAKKLPEFYYPRTSGGTGIRMGLTVVLNASVAEYYCTKSMSVGFKVLVHNPAELPKVSNYGLIVTAGREARIPIEPVYEDALPSIRSIKKSVRRCLFSDENDLAYYRTYSRKNCELECEAKLLLRECNCVLYYLPRIDPASRVCGPNDNICTNRVQTEIESSLTNLSCENCWPGCFELTYKATLSTSSIVSDPRFQSGEDLPDYIFKGKHSNASELSILHFYYVTNTFRSTTKSEMFGFTEFLSNTGGLLGLFMGFSIFSVIEIVYYITVRPYCASRTLHQRRRRRLEQLRWLTPIRAPAKQLQRRLRRRRLLPPAYSELQQRQMKARQKHTLWQTLRVRPADPGPEPPVYPYLD